MIIHELVVMCSFFTFSCTSCVQNRECYWCSKKVKCYKNGGSCEGQIQPNVNKFNTCIVNISCPLKIMCGFLVFFKISVGFKDKIQAFISIDSNTFLYVQLFP